MSQSQFKVHALWDHEAQVWVAESEDVPGLATEADTLENLTDKLKQMIPELLLANQVVSPDSTGAVSFELIGHRQELIELAG